MNLMFILEGNLFKKIVLLKVKIIQKRDIPFNKCPN